MMSKVYLLIGAAVLGLYGAAAFLGWDAGGYARQSAAAASQRHATGGHRSIWILGYRGGK